MQRKGHLRKFVPFEITNFLLYNNLPDYASNHPNHQDNPLPHGTFCWYLKMTQYDLLVWQWPYFRLISPHKNPKSKTYGANGQLGVQKVWKLAFGLRIHRDNRILKAGSQKGFFILRNTLLFKLNSWQGWIFGRVQNCLRPPPPFGFGKSYSNFFNFTDFTQKKGIFLDDHLQEAGPSGWSFARGQSGPRGLTPPPQLYLI